MCDDFEIVNFITGSALHTFRTLPVANMLSCLQTLHGVDGFLGRRFKLIAILEIHFVVATPERLGPQLTQHFSCA